MFQKKKKKRIRDGRVFLKQECEHLRQVAHKLGRYFADWQEEVLDEKRLSFFFSKSDQLHIPLFLISNLLLSIILFEGAGGFWGGGIVSYSVEMEGAGFGFWVVWAGFGFWVWAGGEIGAGFGAGGVWVWAGGGVGAGVGLEGFPFSSSNWATNFSSSSKIQEKLLFWFGKEKYFEEKNQPKSLELSRCLVDAFILTELRPVCSTESSSFNKSSKSESVDCRLLLLLIFSKLFQIIRKLKILLMCLSSLSIEFEVSKRKSPERRVTQAKKYSDSIKLTSFHVLPRHFSFLFQRSKKERIWWNFPEM